MAADFGPVIDDPELRTAFQQAALQAATADLSTGGRSVPATDRATDLKALPAELAAWYRGSDPPLVLNHETRNHMPEDLARYLYCAVHARLKGVSPKAAQFPAALAPRHQNWKTGKFDDRFRVQVAEQPATTVMSHMAKDGHYFIHYDPVQYQPCSNTGIFRQFGYDSRRQRIFKLKRNQHRGIIFSRDKPYLAEIKSGFMRSRLNEQM